MNLPTPPIRDGLALDYPRPFILRGSWHSLDGAWDFALDPEAVCQHPVEVPWEQTIQVPFAPETPRSGVQHTGFFRACWYRRTFTPPELHEGQRLLLHFGAVDYRATVFLNDLPIGSHEGGYTPFSFDITRCVVPGREAVLVVRAFDDPMELAKPRGKQDWQLQPHSIWYPRTTGIWQTVWLEPVPATFIGSVRFTPSLSRWEIGVEVWLDGARQHGLRLETKLHAGAQLLANDTYEVIAGEVHRRIALSDPGIDDSRNELLWSPDAPNLIQVQLRLWAGRGELLDEVHTYTALRAVGVQGDRFVLNGRPCYLRMVLDQGYWPDTGLTAPDGAALRRDVELAKAMGFNGVRKHQKIEDPRYLYWADHLGLMVWEEMPSAYRFTRGSIERLTKEWMEVLHRDVSHPCIVAWVPFNESWGVPNLPTNPAERHYIEALYHLTHTLDPTRPVIGNDGWESAATDIIGIHDYDPDPRRLGRRYYTEDVKPRLLQRERPAGRLLVLEGHRHVDHPIVLSEFGGISLPVDPVEQPRAWGYSRARGPEDLQQRCSELVGVVRSVTLFSGYCYTQFTDTYQETNGLLSADRVPKFPLAAMAAMHGPDPALPAACPSDPALRGEE